MQMREGRLTRLPSRLIKLTRGVITSLDSCRGCERARILSRFVSQIPECVAEFRFTEVEARGIFVIWRCVRESARMGFRRKIILLQLVLSVAEVRFDSIFSQTHLFLTTFKDLLRGLLLPFPAWISLYLFIHWQIIPRNKIFKRSHKLLGASILIIIDINKVMIMLSKK